MKTDSKEHINSTIDCVVHDEKSLEHRVKENAMEGIIAGALTFGFGLAQGYCRVNNIDPHTAINVMTISPILLHYSHIYKQLTLVEEAGKDSDFVYPSEATKKVMSAAVSATFYGTAFTVGAFLGAGVGLYFKEYN